MSAPGMLRHNHMCIEGTSMKKIALASAIALCAGSAIAGGLAEETTMKTEIVEAKTASSASGILIPLLLLILVAAAVSSGGGSSSTSVPG